VKEVIVLQIEWGSREQDYMLGNCPEELAKLCCLALWIPQVMGFVYYLR